MIVKAETALETLHCANCNVMFAITTDYIERRRNDHKGFYCPNGHSNIYPYETEIEKLQKRLNAVVSERDRAITEKLQLNTKLNGALEQLNKAHKGCCPYCSKLITNNNLKRHINSKHPEHKE